MKKYIKKIILTFTLSLGIFGVFASANAAWNTHPSDCPNPLSIGNYTTGEGVQDGTNGCWTKRSISAKAGDIINLAIFYDNTNSSAARNTTITLNKTPSGDSNYFSFYGNLSSSVGGLSLNNVSVSISSNQSLEYSQAKWYKNGSASGSSVNGESAFGSGLILGNIPKGEWGTVLISFKVSQKTVAQACSISNFSASNYTITEGDSTILNWSTNNCVSAQISNVGSVSTSGSKTVYPTNNTTYTLTAYGSDGSSKTKSLTVNVNPYIPPISCSISNFSASNYTITEGDSTILNWSTNNCVSAQISNVGSVSTSGSKTVYPTNNTTYTLTAYGSDGSSKTKSLTVNVNPYVPEEKKVCTINSFNVDREVVNKGEYVTISWNTTNCLTVNIPGIGYGLSQSGSKTIAMMSSKDYTLSAHSLSSPFLVQSKLSVSVLEETIPPVSACVINSFTSDKNYVNEGELVTLSWNTNNCTSVNLSGTGIVGNTGSLNIRPVGNTNYVLSAYGSDGSTQTKNLTINVNPYIPPASCSISNFSASNYTITEGNSTTLNWTTNNCANVSISNLGNVGSTGSLTVRPSVDTNYVLTAYGSDGKLTQRDLRIYVNRESSRSCYVEISTRNPDIYKGDYATLEWNSYGCYDVKITDLGYVSNSGSKRVYPTKNTTYKITGYDRNNNTYTDSVRVYVEEEKDLCRIDSFTTSSSSIKKGEAITLQWRTRDCNNVYVSGIGYVNENGSRVIYPDYSTTYTLTAYGSDRTRSSSVGITVSSQDQKPTISYNNEVVTTVATNITETSARLNGLLSETSLINSSYVYFEYGETVNLGLRTPSRLSSTANFNELLSGLKTNTIYFFRAVAQGYNGKVYKGAIEIFSTSKKVVSSGGGSVSSTTTTTTNNIIQGTTIYGSASPLVLEIGNKYQTIGVGDEMEYFVYYKNISNSVLSYPMIQVYIPKGIRVKNTSNGTYSEADRILSIPLPNLRPAEEGVVYLKATVDSIDRNLSQIVTTAVLVYTNPNGGQENAMAYVLNTPNMYGNNLLGASVFFGGLGLGLGLFGWLLVILLILLIVLVVRLMNRKKENEKVIVINGNGSNNGNNTNPNLGRIE